MQMTKVTGQYFSSGLQRETDLSLTHVSLIKKLDVMSEVLCNSNAKEKKTGTLFFFQC